MLKDQLRSIIGRELDRLTRDARGPLKGRRNQHLVVLAGNGLSRIALARAGKSDRSFESIVSDIVRRTELAPVNHLRARGYTLDEMLRFAMKWAKNHHCQEEFEEEFFTELWRDFASDLVPSPLHKALAAYAAAFISTNYDPLIERALCAVNRYDARYCYTPSMAENTVDSNNCFPKPEPIYSPSHGYVYKIHGSLPFKEETSFGPDAIIPEGWLHSWLADDRKGPKSVVASETVYNYWAYECSDDYFGKKFEGPLSLLGQSDCIFLVIGQGLAAEERVLFRLIQTASRVNPRLRPTALFLTFDSELDHPYVRQSSFFTRINIPLGLAAWSIKRELAFLILLSELVERQIIQDNHIAQAFLASALRSFPEIPGSQARATVDEVVPQLLCVGQAAYHTLRGIEDAPGQERAYGARRATWVPDYCRHIDFHEDGQDTHRDGKAQKRHLDITEPMGNALVPCLFWDALAIPSALVSRVGLDAEGRAVVDFLARNTKYVDFVRLGQDKNPTDTATIACWMDLRLILDGVRPALPKFDLDQVLAPSERGRIIYACKPGLDDTLLKLRDRDLLVFDTGGYCKAADFRKVTEKRSVVIASALSLYMLIEVARKVFDPARTDPPSDRELNAVFDSLYRHKYLPCEPTNETGRYHQIALLLDLLAELDFDLDKEFLRPFLGSARALACTLGPLGCLWWQSPDFREAKWTTVHSPQPLTGKEHLAGQCFPFEQVRNAAGCGDSARAGFAASLLLQGVGTHPDDKALAHAFRSMVWAGGCRVMFWDISSLTRWLAQEGDQPQNSIRRQAHAALKNSSAEMPWPDGLPRTISDQSMSDPAKRGELMHYVELWKQHILCPPDDPLQARTADWQSAIEEWQSARGLEW